MKKLLILAASVALSGTALAQETYFGLSGNTAYISRLNPDPNTNSLGAQLGIRNLLGPFGLRLTGDYSVYPSSGFLEVGGDLLLNVGTVIDPYAGIGVGFISQGGGPSGMIRLFGGIAPRFSPDFGLFGEVSLHMYPDDFNEGFAGKARGGINFFF